MRLKDAGLENDRSFRCCFCCHVRSGTMLLGCFQLILHLFAIACMAFALTAGPNAFLDGAPRVLESNETTEKGNTRDPWSYQWDQLNMPDKNSMCDPVLLFAIMACSLIISLMLVYGTARSRPCYLIPYFCLQVFDFCLHCLTAVGYITYAPNIKMWILDNGLADKPVFNRLMYMDEQRLQILFVIIFLLILSAKAYLINMVWMCHQYLVKRNANRGVVREYTVEPDGEMLLPPKYEEAMKMAPVGPAPPAYTA
ncbi:lysosomal-associated transmembrane protein 4A-like [Dreissena polymorpha]|uniref:Lysosomal-associated transmembrane protein 4A n=1 Tax=Dreissena polymorpha TaxID=45954 RepID=A0A9D4ELZ8_DREPO|nr:lysosomal-associated transmembrane protein 4A-like [Dreissena polymorpha]KAH3782757.1 hypothetical protein DPMN_160676 [Dreissena polymorpha]